MGKLPLLSDIKPGEAVVGKTYFDDLDGNLVKFKGRKDGSKVLVVLQEDVSYEDACSDEAEGSEAEAERLAALWECGQGRCRRSRWGRLSEARAAYAADTCNLKIVSSSWCQLVLFKRCAAPADGVKDATSKERRHKPRRAGRKRGAVIRPACAREAAGETRAAPAPWRSRSRSVTTARSDQRAPRSPAAACF